MITFKFTLNCDTPGCTKHAETSGFIDHATDQLFDVTQRGWLKRGNKCYCPTCAENRMGDDHDERSAA